MKYKVIFTTSYDDIYSITKEFRGDVLILDEENNYYNPQYITLDRIKVEFDEDKICYLEESLVILHTVTKDNILKSILELHKWLFAKRWVPVTDSQLARYFYPKEGWVIFEVEV